MMKFKSEFCNLFAYKQYESYQNLKYFGPLPLELYLQAKNNTLYRIVQTVKDFYYF